MAPQDRLVRGVEHAQQAIDDRDLVAIGMKPGDEHRWRGQPIVGEIQPNDPSHRHRPVAMPAILEQVQRVAVTAQSEEPAVQHRLHAGVDEVARRRAIGRNREEAAVRCDQPCLPGKVGIGNPDLTPGIGIPRHGFTERTLGGEAFDVGHLRFSTLHHARVNCGPA
jgi:hypothetical protein